MTAVSLGCAGLLVTGCGGSEPKPPVAEVKTVEAYGVTLDASATPQQVAYVLLRSIADDYAAASSKDRVAQRKAQELTFALSAPGVMEERLVQATNQINPNAKKKDLGKDRDEKLFKTVHSWAPIVGYYLASFEKITQQELNDRSWLAFSADQKTANLFMPVSHEAATAAAADAETATMNIELNHEAAGGSEYWRVSRVRFLGRHFNAPTSLEIVQAYGVTLDETAKPEQVASVLLQSLDEMARQGRDNKDVRACARYRVFCLVDVAQALVRSRAEKAAAGAGESSASLSKLVDGWADQAASVLLSGPQGKLPEPIPATVDPDGKKATATYRPNGGAGAVTVELVQRNADGKTYWRAVDVNVTPAATTQAAASAAAK
jgi:hypothetical protein